MRPFGDTRTTARWFFLALVAIVVGMVVMERQWLFATPIYEWGDNAANSLQIHRATHLLEYLGNYSRFGFHHPGPAFFYVYAAGEIVFYDVFHLVPAPENAHLLAGVLLQSTFLATAIVVASGFAGRRRGLFIASSVALAFAYFQISGNLELSVWPPDQLVVPFACFVVVAVTTATGRLGLLPVLVICGGFLVHGHVAQPLFVVPLSALSLGLGLRRAAEQRGLTLAGVMRNSVKSLTGAVAVGLLFVAPLIADALQANSNLGKILASLTEPRGPSDGHSLVQIVEYVVSFLGYPLDVYRYDTVRLVPFLSGHWSGFALSFATLVALPAGLLAAHLLGRRRSGRQMDGSSQQPDLAGDVAGSDASGSDASDSPDPSSVPFYLTYAGFLAIAAGLTLVWAAIQKGGIFGFNSYFEYGLIFAAFLPTLVSLCRRWPERGVRPATALAALLAVVVVVSSSVPMPDSEFDEGSVLHRSMSGVLAARTSREPVLLEFATEPDWNPGAAVALDLMRAGVPWYVEPSWALQFGSDRVYHPGVDATPEVWILTAPDPAHAGQILLSSEIAIYPRPPSLATYREEVRA